MSDSLQTLQRWLQAVITHPGGVEAGLASSAAQAEMKIAPGELDSVIPASRNQTSSERVGVYASAYYLRLLECLREFFPCLTHAMGEGVFNDFALAYLQKHPSQSYTLGRLADHFVNFLEATRPPSNSSSENLGWEDFFIDLARLEQGIEVVFDGPGPETGSREQGGRKSLAAATLPFGKYPTPRTPDPLGVRLIPGFQLFAFRFPVSTYYTAWKRDQKPEIPPALPQWIALFRRDYIVRRHELTHIQFELLSDLAADKSLEESIAITAPFAFAAGANPDSFAADLRQWFEEWTRAGFFGSD